MSEKMENQCLLRKIEEQELAGKAFGFYWETIDQLLEQIRSECNEVSDSWQKNDRRHLQEEVGDLIQAAVGLAVFCKLDLNETILKSIEKFQKRYDAVVEMVERDGLPNLHGQSMEVQLRYWDKAKLQP